MRDCQTNGRVTAVFDIAEQQASLLCLQVNVGTAKCNVEQSSCSVVKPRYSFPNSLLLGVLNSFLRCVRPLCHCWCPPFPAGHVAFLFICIPGLSLLVPAMQHFYSFPKQFTVWCPIHLSPRSVTAGVRPFPLAHVASLLICLPGLSLLVSALFHWPCSISVHLSPRCVTAGVRPFPLAMRHFHSFPKQFAVT